MSDVSICSTGTPVAMKRTPNRFSSGERVRRQQRRELPLLGHRDRVGGVGRAREIAQPQRIVAEQMIEAVHQPDVRPVIADADQFDAVAAVGRNAAPRASPSAARRFRSSCRGAAPRRTTAAARSTRAARCSRRSRRSRTRPAPRRRRARCGAQGCAQIAAWPAPATANTSPARSGTEASSSAPMTSASPTAHPISSMAIKAAASRCGRVAGGKGPVSSRCTR